MIRILLVDDHRMMRDGLRILMDGTEDMRVVGEAGDGHAAVELCHTLRPDVTVMDVAMRGMNGADATRQIAELTRVVAISAHADRRFVLRMLDAGAVGYVLKEVAGEELLQAVRTVSAGKAFLSPEITDVVIDRAALKGAGSETSAYSVLGPREREVLQLLAEGMTSPQIGESLMITTRTVETHRRNIMRKLDIHNIAELTKYAIREGLTSLES